MDCFDLMNWRKRRKLTQTELGKHLDVTRRTICNWEAGHTMPRDLVEQLERVALVLVAGQDKHASKAATDVSPDTARHLYEMRRGCWEQKPHHPARLFPDRFDGAIPLEFLQTDEYKSARVALEEAQEAARRADNIAARAAAEEEMRGMPAHAPTCQCMTCRILRAKL